MTDLVKRLQEHMCPYDREVEQLELEVERLTRERGDWQRAAQSVDREVAALRESNAELEKYAGELQTDRRRWEIRAEAAEASNARLREAVRDYLANAECDPETCGGDYDDNGVYTGMTCRRCARDEQRLRRLDALAASLPPGSPAESKTWPRR